MMLYLDRCFVRLDFANGIELLYPISRFDKPFDDLALGDALIEAGLASVSPTVSPAIRLYLRLCPREDMGARHCI